MSILSSLLSVIISALMLSLGIPNELFKLGSALFGLTALVPLYLTLKKTSNWRRAGLLGGMMIMLVHVFSSFWLANFKEFAIFTLGASALANFEVGFLAGALLWYALLYPEHIRPFLFAALWMIWEWFKSIGFLAYPWGTLIMTSRELVPLIQIADITGTWGISFLLALISAMFAEGILTLHSSKNIFLRSCAFTVFLLIIACSYGFYRLAVTEKPKDELKVVIVQQNADSWEEDGLKKTILASQKLTRKALDSTNEKADLIIWSESVLTYPYNENREYYTKFPWEDPLSEFLAEIDTPLLVGSPVLVDPVNTGFSNSVILLSPSGERLDWFGKIQLVPFAEYMPFTEYAFVRTFFDKLVGFSRGWVPGNRYSPLTIQTRAGKNIHFAPPICFEDAFPSVTSRLHNEGADLLINLTNDSWSKTESAEYQHFVIASFRSIELRTTLIRSTNAGYSVVLDSRGNVLYDLPLFKAESMFVTVPIYPHVTTFYARFGDWLPGIISLFLSFYFLFRKSIDRKQPLR